MFFGQLSRAFSIQTFLAYMPLANFFGQIFGFGEFYQNAAFAVKTNETCLGLSLAK